MPVPQEALSFLRTRDLKWFPAISLGSAAVASHFRQAA
jgi:hypothetical protein